MAMLALLPHFEAEAKQRQRQSGLEFGRGKVVPNSEQPIVHDRHPGRSIEHAAKLAGVGTSTRAARG